MKATCTWGEGPDVIVELKGTPFILYEKPKHRKPPRGDYKHGYITEGSFDLTADEAEAYVYQLVEAIEEVRHIQRMYNEFVEGDKDESIRRSRNKGAEKE